MNTKELIEAYGEEVSDYDFLKKLLIPFTVITSETLEIAKKEFIDYAMVNCYSFKPKVLISYELEAIPLYSKKYDSNELTKEDLDLILNCMSFTLARSGTFKKPAYVYKEDGSFIDVRKINTHLRNKMIYFLSPRISYCIEKGLESALINMLRTKKFVVKQGKKFCFLKSHMLVDPKLRPKLKKEVQIIFDFGMSKLSVDEFEVLLKTFEFILISKE